MTPLHLEILLWHNSHCEPMANHDAPAVVDYRNHFLKHEILWQDDANPSGYSLTNKGQVWLTAILETPFPVLQYVMPARF